MRANTNLFWILFGFFILADAAYTIWSLLYYGHPEWVGTVAIGLTGIMSAFIAFYLGKVMSSRAVSSRGPPRRQHRGRRRRARALQPVVVVAHPARGCHGALLPRCRSRAVDRPDRARLRGDHPRRLGLRVLPRQLRSLTWTSSAPDFGRHHTGAARSASSTTPEPQHDLRNAGTPTNLLVRESTGPPTPWPQADHPHHSERSHLR